MPNPPERLHAAASTMYIRKEHTPSQLDFCREGMDGAGCRARAGRLQQVASIPGDEAIRGHVLRAGTAARNPRYESTGEARRAGPEAWLVVNRGKHSKRRATCEQIDAPCSRSPASGVRGRKRQAPTATMHRPQPSATLPQYCRPHPPSERRHGSRNPRSIRKAVRRPAHS